MIPLAVHLDDIDYDRLVALARSRIPAQAPGWTDYNFSDPGIMLIELLAWLADSQVYSLARNRLDERAAMLGLMRRTVRGASPARGVVYPAIAPSGVENVAKGAVLTPLRGGVPRVESVAAITVLPLDIAHIEVRGRDGVSTGVTAEGGGENGGFDAFGPAGEGSLRITFEHRPMAATNPVRLSLGFRMAHGSHYAADRSLGGIEAAFEGRPAVVPLLDTTDGLQRSGAMVFEVEPEAFRSPLVLRRARGTVLVPHILEIRPNALPVEQRASLKVEDWRGTGRPGQILPIEPPQLFPANEASPERSWRLVDGPDAVEIESFPFGRDERWNPGSLDKTGPDDRVYAMGEAPDGTRISIRFGNGVNGRRPALSEPFRASVRVSCGSRGNIGQATAWRIAGSTAQWRNAEPITGGTDGDEIADALARLRAELDSARPIATSRQLEDAAMALPSGLDIARVRVEEGWERGRRTPAIVATRTLVVAHKSPGNETAAWLRAIRDRLAPRIAIGERLIVAAPRYRRFTLSVRISRARGHSPEQVKRAVRDSLAERFRSARRPWPFEQDVAAVSIAGWVRRVDGVASVSEVRITADSTPVASLSIARGELPLLTDDPDVVTGEQPR